MGRLAKERKRAASKANFNKKQSQSRPQQGGRSISASRRASQLTKNNLSNSPLLKDGNTQRVQQLRNVQQQSQNSFLNNIVSREQRQENIANIRRQRKAARIEDEFDSIEQARKTIQNSNLSETAKRQLLANFNDKERRLNQDLAGLTPGQSAANRRQEAKIRSLQQTIEQQRFSIRQAQGSSGERRVADPIANSLAVTPGGNAKVRAIAAKLGQNIQELSRLRQEQQGPQRPRQKSSQNAFDIPKPSKKTVNPLSFSSFLGTIDKSTTENKQTVPSTTTSQAPKKKDDFGKDAFEGFTTPFINFGRLIANTPEAIRRDVEQFAKTGKTFDLVNPFDPESRAKKQLTEGEKFFQKEALNRLQPTVVDSALTGKPTGRSKTFDFFSGLGEAAFFAAPFAAGKGVGPAASITSKLKPGTTTKAPAHPQTQAPTLESIAKGVVQNNKKKKITNPRRVPRNVFAQDKAEPTFVNTLVSLGRGTTKTPEGGAFPTFTFGKPGGKGSGSTKPRTFQDPKPKSGDKIIQGKDGLFQIQKTKTKTVTKQKTQQKTTTESRQFLQRQINLGTGKVKQVSTQKSLLKNPFPKQKVKQKSKAQTKTEEFFRQQSKSAKKRQRNSIFGILLPRELQGQRQTQSSRLETAKPTKQQQRTLPPLLLFRPSTKTTQKQKQSSVFSPIVQQRQARSFVPITPTSTITSFLNPARERVPPRGALGRGGFLPFLLPGGGGGGDPFTRGGRFGRKFLVSNLDPTRAGVISAANVPDLLKGSTERVFVAGDKALAKERKRQGVGNSVGDILSNPFRGLADNKPVKGKSRKSKSKKKRRKSLLDDPLG